MDPYSSGEETVIKTRKPYTITKQRERWTEEEHNRFLEALKLHGRAWQRIEEHIGTKTAVQIRSHAQKFFTKLEKEALVKGVPVSQALDIEIPPPRPKRKPCNPYPRKTSARSSSLQLIAKDGKSLTSLSSSHCVKDVLDLEKEPIPEKCGGDGMVGNVNKDQDEENCSEPFSFMQDASSNFREFVPVLEKVNNQDQTNESSYITIEPRRNQKSDNAQASNTSKLGNSHPLHQQLVQDHNPDDKLGNFGAFSIKGAQNYPRHVPVHIVDGSLGSAHNISSSEISYQEHHSNASRLSIDEIFPAFHPLLTPPVHGNQDDLLNMWSTFSNLIVSTLLQNPSAHAAARFAATMGQSNCSGPRIAAIAGATVAAATAWWAAHGLLPPPIHQAFTCPPPPPSPWAPPRDTCQPNIGGHNTATPPEGVFLDAIHPKVSLEQQSGSKSKETEGIRERKLSNGDGEEGDELGFVDSSKVKIRKQVDRSSCGSNTASSSDDIETDALEKNEKAKDKEELKEADDASPSSDSSNCRSRSYITLNDSWKEVSEEGRLAFHALFSREVLPQSFSPPLDPIQQKSNMIQSTSHVDLNSQQPVEMMTSLRGDENGMLSIGLGQVKHRTGFKPYKRCSVEAKESRMACTRGQNDEKAPKRMRLGGEAST